MRSRREALHFLKEAETVTGKPCFIRSINKQRGDQTVTVWKIFTSEDDYESYLRSGQHLR
jgi:hypothetical protein